MKPKSTPPIIQFRPTPEDYARLLRIMARMQKQNQSMTITRTDALREALRVADETKDAGGR